MEFRYSHADNTHTIVAQAGDAIVILAPTENGHRILDANIDPTTERTARIVLAAARWHRAQQAAAS